MTTRNVLQTAVITKMDVSLHFKRTSRLVAYKIATKILIALTLDPTKILFRDASNLFVIPASEAARLSKDLTDLVVEINVTSQVTAHNLLTEPFAVLEVDWRNVAITNVTLILIVNAKKENGDTARQTPKE
jgi:hypothetical protein